MSSQPLPAIPTARMDVDPSKKVFSLFQETHFKSDGRTAYSFS